MFAFAAGDIPAQKTRAAVARAASSAALAVVIAALGGCSSTQHAATAQDPGATMRVAQAVSEVEDDGLPAQTPPPHRIRQSPDDPSEPFSRNYGGGNPSASAAPAPDAPANEHAPHPQIPADLPPAFRQKLAAALDVDE
ncbi:MAG: adhesin [Hyphomicrobium sp.]